VLVRNFFIRRKLVEAGIFIFCSFRLQGKTQASIKFHGQICNEYTSASSPNISPLIEQADFIAK